MAAPRPTSDSIEADYSDNLQNGAKDLDHKGYLERYQTASSVVIPREVFESMYLSPYMTRQGHLRSIFANPTPMYVAFTGKSLRALPLTSLIQAAHGLSDRFHASGM